MRSLEHLLVLLKCDILLGPLIRQMMCLPRQLRLPQMLFKNFGAVREQPGDSLLDEDLVVLLFRSCRQSLRTELRVPSLGCRKHLVPNVSSLIHERLLGKLRPWPDCRWRGILQGR